ncbi:phosphodiester glycosidase family protein [Rubinisphaera margarita]|uniref:phosphodiester glycosidase family protein n=1 Tax=Rubinisphaera margarita TaxID=2909586 RepID=UPI001EE8E4FE|nr:phosphodiester glycosidase family protein [Rubinisphaera margarita]MCG6158208.1 phosphodiester glycosidase family protein [Rubinisphaera margarita]
MCTALVVSLRRVVRLLCGLLALFPFRGANAADPLPQPTRQIELARGVDLRIWKLQDPTPHTAYAVTLDLNESHIRPGYTIGGVDPDGTGEFHTTNMTVLGAAERLRYDVAINTGVLVQPPESSDAGDGWGKAYPATMVSGKWLTAPPDDSKATVVVVHRDGHFSIVPALSVPEDAWHVFPAHTGQLVDDGEPCRLSSRNTSTTISRHPRTAIGVDEIGMQVTLLVVDGRDSSEAVGVTTDTLEDWMVGLRIYDAANLWGGGNTTLVLREQTQGPLRVFNEPSDRTAQGFIKLRSAQTTLGFSVYESGAFPR